jgi:hypothetical protein
MTMEKIQRLLPTDTANLTAGLTALAIPAVWTTLPSILELMPFSLAADMLLTRITITLLLLIVALFIILCSVIRSHNRLAIALKEAEFSEFLRNPIC